jgi:hypothetical protein
MLVTIVVAILVAAVLIWAAGIILPLLGYGSMALVAYISMKLSGEIEVPTKAVPVQQQATPEEIEWGKRFVARVEQSRARARLRANN